MFTIICVGFFVFNHKYFQWNCQNRCYFSRLSDNELGFLVHCFTKHIHYACVNKHCVHK